jgi:glycosyltransferase involved in cell wall biosynthesis
MKIAIVNWPILDVGGITSWIEDFTKGLRLLDIQVDHFYATSGREYGCDAEKKTFIGDKYIRGEKLPGGFLSYGKENVDETVTVLNSYDAIVMAHPSPHPTKSQFSSSNPLGWVKLYKNTTRPKIVIIHDALWKKTNTWWVLVREFIDLIVVGQRPNFESILNFPSSRAGKIWVHHPMDLEGVAKPSHSRKGYGIVAHQWIKWKNHHKIIAALDGSEIPMVFYAGGQEYHNLLANGIIAQFFKRNEVEKAEYENEQPVEHIYKGFVSRDDLKKTYAEALFSIDGSTRGYNNYTHWEPMLYGCISLVHEDVFSKPGNAIPNECCVQYNWNNLKEQIKWIMENGKEVRTIRRKAYDFIREKFNCKDIAHSILYELEQKREIVNSDVAALPFEEKALEANGWPCIGTMDLTRGSEEFKQYCADCVWVNICEEYTRKHPEILEKQKAEAEAAKKAEEAAKSEQPNEAPKLVAITTSPTEADAAIQKIVKEIGPLPSTGKLNLAIDFEKRTVTFQF